MRLLAAVALLAVGAASAQTGADRLEWTRTDFSRRTVELAEIESGGPPKDGIPAIDRPRFVAASAAGAWVKPKEPVIALRIGESVRAYPLQILMYHEIVNDTFDGVPVAVTFCPLCNASIVFDRRVGGATLDFGTTGKLRYSDLVMYDRQTESWWQQFTGKGIVGRYAGAALKRLPSEIIAFGDFAVAHPTGEVLSRATGYLRPYGRNPYAGYDRIDQSPFLYTGKRDPRLPPMERVLSVSLSGRHRLYPLDALQRRPVANEELGGVPYVVLAKAGMASPLDHERVDRGGGIVDTRSGSQWNVLGEAVAGPLKGRRLTPIESGVHFAFAWLAFNPDSEIVRPLP